MGPKYSIDLDSQGSAFFVAMRSIGGVFLTAKHVVESHTDEKPHSILILDANEPSKFYATQVRRLALHPEFDAAVGLVDLAAPLPMWRVGRRRPADGEPFVAFGFPSTQFAEFSRGEGIVISLHTAEVKGVIDIFQDRVPLVGPAYMHFQPTAGGISGGPVVGLDGCVYALNSRGGAREFALAIESLLDWELPILGGRTLGSLLEEHEAGVIAPSGALVSGEASPP